MINLFVIRHKYKEANEQKVIVPQKGFPVAHDRMVQPSNLSILIVYAFHRGRAFRLFAMFDSRRK